MKLNPTQLRAWIEAGKGREEIAGLCGVTLKQLDQGLYRIRKQGVNISRIRGSGGPDKERDYAPRPNSVRPIGSLTEKVVNDVRYQYVKTAEGWKCEGRIEGQEGKIDKKRAKKPKVIPIPTSTVKSGGKGLRIGKEHKIVYKNREHGLTKAIRVDDKTTILAPIDADVEEVIAKWKERYEIKMNKFKQK